MSKHINVTVIEIVENICDGDTIQVKEEKCEKRELFWQRQLRTFTTYGGLNIRGGNKYYLPKP